MGLRSWLRERRARVTAPSSVADPSAAIVDLFGGAPSKSGVEVTPDSALAHSAVFACVKVLSETLASVPLVVWRKRSNGRGKDRATDHPLYRLLHRQPNGEQTSFGFREVMMAHLALRGNALAFKDTTKGGTIRGLWPLRPDRVTKERRNGVVLYHWQPYGGTRDTFTADEVVHIAGPGDGFWGVSPITLARETVGLGLAAEEFGARLFSNGASPRGVFKHPAKLSEEAYKRLKASLDIEHQGLSNANKRLLLEEGMEWQQVGIAPDDAQFLETRKFQVNEVARWYRVPPHMIGDLERATFSNVEHQSQGFVQFTMLPWFVRWEQVLEKDCLAESERDRIEIGFVVQGLMRGDFASRMQGYAVGRQWGWLSADDVRELEDMNPLPDGQGEVYLQPLNMVPAGTEPEPVVEDAPPGPEPEKPSESDDERSIELRRGKRHGGAVMRRRLGRSFVRVFEDAATRLVNREQNEIIGQAKKWLGQRDVQAFSAWLEEFYAHEVPEIIRRTMTPAFTAYADAVAASALDDVAADAALPDTLPAFVSSLIRAFIARHSAQSRNVVRITLDKSADDPIPALEAQFEAWRSERPAQIARRETVKSGNAVAAWAFAGLGVVRMRWVAFGENCPICDRYDGRTVEVGHAFAREGETVEGEGFNPLVVQTDVSHPPLHDGCDCGIAPE